MPMIRAGRLRVIAMLFFFGLTAVGLAFKTGIGTLCNLGFGAISAICPLGALETALAGRSFPLRTLISLGVVVVIVAVLGRFFCAWVCPAPFFRGWIPARIFHRVSTEGAQSCMSTALRLFGRPYMPSLPSRRAPCIHASLRPLVTKPYEISGLGDIKPASDPVPPNEIHNHTIAAWEEHPKQGRFPLDSRYYILGGALLSSAIFGFPVFCLVCPVGLILASFIGAWRLFQYNEPSWMLLVFPAIFLLEIAICRKWCRKICPLGALLSLLSGLNYLFRPSVNRDVCRRASQSMECALCAGVCEEDIDLHNREKSRPLSECTKCRECADICPAGAISFPLLPVKSPRGGSDQCTAINFYK